MGKRSKVPKWIERGEGKSPGGKGPDQPMTFKRMKGRTPRPDTGKKLSKWPSRSPNYKI